MITKPALVAELHELLGRVGVGLLGGPILHELESLHRAKAANIADDRILATATRLSVD